MLGRLLSVAGLISAGDEVPQTDDRENPLEDYPIIVGSGTEIFCISSIEGDLKWKKKIAGAVNSVPVVNFDNHVFVTADDDALYAFDQADSTQKWKFETDDAITLNGFKLAKDEKSIFVPCMDGLMYNLNIESYVPKVSWKFQARIKRNFITCES